MSPIDHSPSLNDDQRVRALWNEFEKWAQSQRKLLERRRADIIYKQIAKRKKLSSRGQIHAADDDEITKQQLEAAGEDHTNMLLSEWHKLMENQHLGPDAWGTRTIEEAERIARLFQTEDAIDRSPPPLQHYTQPQSVPVYNSVPSMTSAGRRLNFSSSTSSSKFVDPSSLSTDDDEADDVEEQFRLTTDEFDNEFWMPSNVCGPRSKSSTHSSQNGSPDNLSSSSSSAFEFLQPPSLSSSLLETHMEPPKRPPDTERKGKARARGPTYVGPHLLSPEESSDEDDFATFRMQTRIHKIWEFHLAAARADVELAIAIQNERLSKDSSWDESEYETRISEHEKRLERLRDEKEKERQELVVAERRKRREDMHKRPALHAHTTNAHIQSDWESLFQNKDHPVRFDAEKRSFSLGSSDEAQTKGTLRFESHADVPASVLSNHRTRKQSQSNASSSSSGWKTKTSPPTASAQAGLSTSSESSRSWFDRSLEENGELLDFDGNPAHNSNSLPIPAGWGEKSWGEKPSANSLLKKVLSDPSSRKYSSLSSVVEPEFNSKAAMSSGPSKRPIKNLKGRQPNLGSFDYDAAAESPTTPTANTSARGFAGMVSARDILQSRHAHLQTDDEMSSTPRPRMESAFGTTAWKTNGQDTLSRPGKLPARHSQFEDEGWGNVHALADKAMEAMMTEEGPQWGHKQVMREGRTWGRGMQSDVSAATKQSSTGPEVSLWQQQQKARSRVQPSAFVDVPRAQDVQEDFWTVARAKLNAEATQSTAERHSIVTEETPWQRMQRLKAEKSLPSAAGSSMNPFDQPPARKGLHSSKPSWSGASNLEDSVPDMAHPQSSVPAQFSNKYWTPNGTGSTSQMWNDGAQSIAKQSTTMPGGYMSDTQHRYDNFGSASVSSSYGNTRMRSSYTKHATVEEEPDEDGPGGRDAQIGALPYDSRFILDVAVPKPIHPPEAYSDVIEYDEDPDEENEWDHSLGSPAQTPSTAPTSPPSDMTEEWMNAVTENLKNGKLEDMDFDSFGTNLSNKTKPASASSGLPTKQSVWGAQKPDTVKVQSIPESAPTSSTSPPKAVPASDPPSASSKAAAPAPAKATAAPEKPEPVVKTGNQNQKGKKGKGKGRK
ncbi:hypothetical protein C0993_000169 [Termitomyces sp. T159_Od127]|nr:hypothetical protein C0993_000169 [Termitomyces sp. T159_Od127]